MIGRGAEEEAAVSVGWTRIQRYSMQHVTHAHKRTHTRCALDMGRHGERRIGSHMCTHRSAYSCARASSGNAFRLSVSCACLPTNHTPIH